MIRERGPTSRSKSTETNCAMLAQSLVVLSLLAISVSAAPRPAGGDLIVQKPISGKTGPEKLLVIINGAYVANTDYAELGE